MKVYRSRECNQCGKNFTPKSGNHRHCAQCSAAITWFKTSQLVYTKRLSRLCKMAENRAKTKGLDFNITKEHLIKLWEDNEGCCSVTGRIFDLNSWGNKGQVNPNAPSVDRIVPSKGYVKGNVRLIVYHLNIALSDFGEEEFEKLAKDYLHHA